VGERRGVTRADTEFKLARAADVALLTIDNGEDHTKPTFIGRAALESLERALDELERLDVEALVVTGKPFIFCAGADITAFPNVTPDLAREGSRAGHELFGRLRALPYPSVAAVNGVCLGGGLEVALHCDARTIATTVRHLGFPEVFLGLFPAWGGTQLAPRLIGAEAAVKLIVTNPLRQNRMLSGPEAHALGLADRLLEPVELLDESIAFARELARDGLPERPQPDVSELDTVLRRARNRVDDAVHGAAPAPYRALELIELALRGGTVEEGYAAEEDAIAELLPGPEAQASIYAFDLVEQRAKRGVGVPKVEVPALRKVGIVGAGLMATQIATLFLRRLEVPIVLRDVSQEILERSHETIRGELAEQVSKGRYDEGKARFLGSIVETTTGYDGFEDCDLVLEAVVERLDVKQQVFAELRERVRPEAVLASNTSSLSLAEMGADVGLHFFNPVAVMPLVEIVRTAETRDVALATAWEVTKRLRKRGVVVADAPGFVVNRVLTRMTRVLMDALEHGNTVEETDEAMLGLGMPMAPSVLLQMVGPQVANHVLETMHDAFPDRFPLSPTLAAFAEGRDELVVLGDRRRSVEEIREDALEAVADEIHRLLDEGVVAEAADVDTALILGAGWPFFLGGITKHFDQTGLSERLFGRPFAEQRVAAPA
jgi:3-hydroxyacyl-CoA dehydrogenase/enoyl-CoA hydratase/carnithine racemase